MFIFPIIGWSKAALMVQEVPAKGNFWKTLLQILFWSSINNMAFLLSRHLQHGFCFFLASTIWLLFCSSINNKDNLFMKYSAANQASSHARVTSVKSQQQRSFWQSKAMIGHEPYERVLNRINNMCYVQNVLHGTSLPGKCEEKEGRIIILLVWKLLSQS